MSTGNARRLFGALLLLSPILFTGCNALEILRVETPLAYVPGAVPVDKASAELDSHAKEIQPEEDTCIVYFVNPAPTWFLSGIDCFADQEHVGRMSSRTFVFCKVKPGEHSFSTLSFDMGETRTGAVGPVHLEAGKKHYFEQVFDNVDRLKYRVFPSCPTTGWEWSGGS